MISHLTENSTFWKLEGLKMHFSWQQKLQFLIRFSNTLVYRLKRWFTEKIISFTAVFQKIFAADNFVTKFCSYVTEKKSLPCAKVLTLHLWITFPLNNSFHKRIIPKISLFILRRHFSRSCGPTFFFKFTDHVVQNSSQIPRLNPASSRHLM